MRKLINDHKAPPGGWRFEDPDTGFRFDGLNGSHYVNFTELLSHIRRYREHNSLEPIPALRIVVQNWLCEQPNMVGWCKDYVAQRSKRTLKHYVKGAKALFKAVLAEDDGLASQITAEARARVCLSCPYNLPNLEDTLLGKYTDMAVAEYVGERTVESVEDLFSCQLCTCPLRSKVHFSQKIIEESLTKEEKDALPDYCWQKKPISED